MLEIRLLGEPAVIHNGELVSLPQSKKTRALLAFLALAKRPARRERLCEMFWEIPDDPRGALRWSLSKLRPLLNEEGVERLKATREAVAFDPAGAVLDAVLVEDSLARGVDTLPTEDLKGLAALFRGEFIEGLSLSGSPEFEAWRVAMADRFATARILILRHLVDRLRDAPEEALPHAHTLAALLPEDEDLAARVRDLAQDSRKNAFRNPPASPVLARSVVLDISSSVSMAQPQAAGQSLLPVTRGSALMPADGASLAGPSGQVVQYCRAKDGVRLAYTRNGSGTPVVKACNWLSHLDYDLESPIWRHWIEGLTRHHDYVRYDERLNGLSDWEAEDLSFDTMVEDLACVVEAAGFERFALLGVSQGCAISIAYAARYPERVTRLVLYGGYVQGWRARGDPIEIAQREAMTTLIGKGWERDNPAFRQMFTSLFIPGATAEQRDWFNELLRRAVSPENAVRLTEAFSRIDVTDYLAEVRVPTLVMHAQRDAVVPFPSGEAIAAGIPGARFVPLDSANHILLAHEPAFARFLDETERFLSGNAPGGDEHVRRSSVGALDRLRKPVTAVVAELISPLEALSEADPESVVGFLDPLVKVLMDCVGEHGGIVTNVQHGIITAIFGVAEPSEDHAKRGARAALDMIERIRTSSSGAARVKIGVHTGDAVVRHGSAQPQSLISTNDPVAHHAARLAYALRREMVVVSRPCLDALGSAAEIRPLTAKDAAMLGRDARGFRLVTLTDAGEGGSGADGRMAVRIIGRDGELSQLMALSDRAKRGQGAAVGIYGEPGLGKSRLTREFLHRLPADAFTVLQASNRSFDHRVSHQLVARIIQVWAGIVDNDARMTATEKLRAALGALGPEFESLYSPLAFAVGLDVADPAWEALSRPVRRDQLHEAFKAVITRQAKPRPLVLVLEDLHWADAESLPLVDMLVELAGALPLLLILTYRPEHQHSWWRRGWFSEFRLQSLDQPHQEQMLRELLGPDPSLDLLRGLVIDKTMGVPLFIEESVRALADRKIIAGAPGKYRLVRRVFDIDIPSNVKSVIAARIDKLRPEDRRVLQLASVIGVDVPLTLLEAIAGLDGVSLSAALRRLHDAEFLFEAQSFPSVEYRFKHALTHDVAYDSILRGERKDLHARVLAVLEDRYGDRRAEHVERFADHALNAEKWDEAVDYLVDAASKAESMFAYHREIRFLQAAADTIEKLDRTPELMAKAVDIRTRMRPAFDALGDYRTAIMRLDEARSLAERLSDTGRISQVLIHQGYMHAVHGRFEPAMVALGELEQLSSGGKDEHMLREARLAMAQAHLMRGKARSCNALIEPYLEHYAGPLRHERFGHLATRSVWCFGHYGLSCAYLGRFEMARRYLDECQRIAREVERPFDLLAAAYFDGMGRSIEGNVSTALEDLRQALALCARNAVETFTTWLLAAQGAALTVAEEWREAFGVFDEVARIADHYDMPQFKPFVSVYQAEARLRSGRGLSAEQAGEALHAARLVDNPWLEMKALRVLWIADGAPADATLLAESNRIAEKEGFSAELDRGQALIWECASGAAL